MRVLTVDNKLPDDARGAAVALGNFDGLHAGHRAVIERARGKAKRLGAPFGVATFEPPPRRHFQPDAPPFRLMTPLQRELSLKTMGVDMCALLHFGAEMAAMTDREFCEVILVERMGVRSVTVGFDFHFGKNRMGSAESLQRLGAELGFDVQVVEKVSHDGAKASSTLIRGYIEQGEMDTAREALGQWWTVDAVVEHGEKRGRTLGFPTANMRLGDILNPSHGIYAVWARIEGENQWRPGVANFGRTPTTGLRDPLLEVMLFDWSGDLYGRRLHVAFARKLRDEEKFVGLDELKSAMTKDVSDARAVLAASINP